MPRLSSRSDILSQSRADPAYLHKVIFVIRQKNMDQLTAILHSVSDPLSSSYGNHLTKEEIDKMTFNENSRDAVVSYLQSTGTTIVSESLNGEYITAEASIESWEKIFHAEFYIFHQKHQDGRVEKLVRAEKYWIPKELDAHVESVFKVVEMPLISSGKLPKLFPTPTSGSSSGSGSRSVNIETVTINKITPAIIRKFYNVSSTATGSSYSTQAIFATIGQYMSSSDLLSFQTIQNLTKQNIFSSIGNHVSSTYCLNDPGNCAEGNLDTQYIMSMSPSSPTIYWYTDLSFSDFLVSVSNTLSPPLVISISYGQEEDYTTDSELLAFNTQSIKLGAMGVTILVASGDDGATSRLVRTSGPSMCRYSPSFPATSPYVISVGATSVRSYLNCIVSYCIVLCCSVLYYTSLALYSILHYVRLYFIIFLLQFFSSLFLPFCLPTRTERSNGEMTNLYPLKFWDSNIILLSFCSLLFDSVLSYSVVY